MINRTRIAAICIAAMIMVCGVAVRADSALGASVVSPLGERFAGHFDDATRPYAMQVVEAFANGPDPDLAEQYMVAVLAVFGWAAQAKMNGLSYSEESYEAFFDDDLKPYAVKVAAALANKPSSFAAHSYKIGVVHTRAWAASFAYLMGPVYEAMRGAPLQKTAVFSMETFSSYACAPDHAVILGFDGKNSAEGSYSAAWHPGGASKNDDVGDVVRVAAGKISLRVFPMLPYDRLYGEKMRIAKSWMNRIPACGDQGKRAYSLRLATRNDSVEPVISESTETDIPAYCVSDMELPYRWDAKNGLFRESRLRVAEDGQERASAHGGKMAVALQKYYRERLERDKALAGHVRRYNAVWERFIALFGPEVAPRVRALQWEWLRERQNVFAGFSKNRPHLTAEQLAEAFREEVLEFDGPHLRYMELVLRLMAQPDVKLVMALDGLQGTIMNSIESLDSERRYLQNFYKSFPQDMSYFLPRDTLNDPAFRDPVRLVIGKTKARRTVNCGFSSYDNETHSVYSAPKGELWGVSTYYFDGKHNKKQQVRVLRVAGGKISFLTPPSPVEERFFRGQAVSWMYPPMPPGESYNECSMGPALAVEDTPGKNPPFRVRGIYFQGNLNTYTSAWECVPECSVPYVWKKGVFVEGKPECLAQGEWGPKQP